MFELYTKTLCLVIRFTKSITNVVIEKINFLVALMLFSQNNINLILIVDLPLKISYYLNNLFWRFYLTVEMCLLYKI